jgi:hypothetical protein
MTPQSRLIVNLLLPLLLFCGSYLLLYQLGEGLLEEMLLQGTAIGISALLAALPPLAFRFIIHSQIKDGFALMKSGRIVIPGEITLSEILGDQVTAWKLFQQHLDTEVCLQGKGELVYVQLGLDFTIPATEQGKKFVRHFKTNRTVFEAWVQRAIYLSSAMDRELAHSLARGALMNEEDEQTLRSKFLSALEAHPLRSVELPVDTAGLNVYRKVRVIQKVAPVTASSRSEDQQLDDDLSFDSALLEELGLHSAS